MVAAVQAQAAGQMALGVAGFVARVEDQRAGMQVQPGLEFGGAETLVGGGHVGSSDAVGDSGVARSAYGGSLLMRASSIRTPTVK